METSKNCWKIRHELYGKGQRISIHSFEAAALSETTHYATVKVEPNIMRLTEKGKTVELAKNNALCKLMSFLTNLLNLLKDFKWQQNISAVFLIFWQYKKMPFGSISGAVNNSISGGIFNNLAVRIIQMAAK